MFANEQASSALDDDSFLDWETRDEAFPFYKHIIAGIYIVTTDSMVGSCAGIMEHVGMFPLIFVKVSNFSSLSIDSFFAIVDASVSKWP